MNMQQPSVLDLTGLGCASCVGRAEKALLDAHGVAGATIDLAETFVLEVMNQTAHAAGLAEPVTATACPATVEASDFSRPRRSRGGNEVTGTLRRALFAAGLALPATVFEMVQHLTPSGRRFVKRSVGARTSWLIQFVLTPAVLAWPRQGFFRPGAADSPKTVASVSPVEKAAVTKICGEMEPAPPLSATESMTRRLWPSPLEAAPMRRLSPPKLC